MMHARNDCINMHLLYDENNLQVKRCVIIFFQGNRVCALLLCYKNCLQRTLKLQDQALINHEMAELEILGRQVMWFINVGLNVTVFPTMLLSVYSIEWHRWCSVCDIESFFLVSNNLWPHYLFMCCSYCTFLISSFAVSLPSVSSAFMFHQ